MVKENIQDPNDRTAILKGSDDEAFAFAYVELREATRYKRKHFMKFAIGRHIDAFFRRQIPRYRNLPQTLKNRAEQYAEVYHRLLEKDIKRTKMLQSPENSVFTEAFEELRADCTYVRDSFLRSAFWKRLEEKRLEFYQKRYDSLKAH